MTIATNLTCFVSSLSTVIVFQPVHKYSHNAYYMSVSVSTQKPTSVTLLAMGQRFRSPHSRFLSSPITIRVPFLLLLGFNKGTLK